MGCGAFIWCYKKFADNTLKNSHGSGNCLNSSFRNNIQDQGNFSFVVQISNKFALDETKQ